MEIKKNLYCVYFPIGGFDYDTIAIRKEDTLQKVYDKYQTCHFNWARFKKREKAKIVRVKLVAA